MARSLSAGLILMLSLSLASALEAQVPDSLPRASATFDLPRFQFDTPDAVRAPWLGAPRSLVAFDSAMSSALDSARRVRAGTLRAFAIYGRGAADSTAAPERPSLLGIDRKYADLAIDGQASLDIRTERVKNERCTAFELQDPNSNCGGRIRAPRLDNFIDVRAAGLLGQRVHVTVDFQSQRDFSANNLIQVYYEGLQDEIIRRLEVGTVTFRPPASRFLTAAVPSSNFGINGLFDVGPLQFQALFATQKGSSVGERVFQIGGESTRVPQDRLLRDVDFESGRFYWVVDPTRLSGYPAIDILNVDAAALPALQRPQEVRVYRYRAALGGSSATPIIGGVKAYARNSADPSQVVGVAQPDEGVQWELLVPGRDYYVEPGGLWFALASKLDPNDYLAVSYTTVGGDPVGSFPSADRPAEIDSLELIVEPRRGPSSGTFRHEMRQVYRVAGSDLDRSSLEVAISLNRSERPAGGAPTYLAQLDIAVPTDPARFDRENRLFPRSRDPGAEDVIRESYVVMPHLTPFADPSRLTPVEVTDSLYRTPLYLVLSSQGPPSRFQFRLQYSAASGTDRSRLDLGAIQIKEESEQIEVNNRLLVRGVDYSIDYLSGLLTFSNPEALFGAGAGTVRARFEQQDLFAIAPTTIMGLTSRYSLGRMGSVNLVGVFQREASAYNRPQLGFEASANMVGGIVTDLHFQSDAITRMLNRVVSGTSTAPSRLDINAELAISKPDPNRSGAAYLEEFDSDQAIAVSLRETNWRFASAPQSTDGLDPSLGIGAFNPDDAVQMTWQNLVPGPDGRTVQLRPQDIDTTIVLAGSGDQFETVLWTTFHADTAGGFVRPDRSSAWSFEPRPLQPRWRSFVTSLSPTGLDLSRTEYLEFYVYQSGLHSADSAGLQLVIDLGTVNEDAVGIAPTALVTTGSDTVFTGRQLVGQGKLDTERGADGIFNASTDDIGILGDRPDTIAVNGEQVEQLPLCQRLLTAQVLVFPWGDLSSRCSNGNGVLDTEDLNGDNLLNATGAGESVMRYVVPIGDSTYIVPGRGLQIMDAGGRPAGFVLYRIPLRSDAAISLGAPNLRLVQHLRVTFVAPPDDGEDVVARLALSRLRLVGAPWSRRAESPIAGLSGAIGQPHGEVLTATVSTENVEVNYQSPPGVRGSLNDRNAGQNQLGTQVNEKSLRVIARGLQVNERAEAYLRFPAGAQNLLNYRELRVWTRGYGDGWERGDLQAFVKLGSDDRNFYLYRAPALTTTWEPEMVIDLEVWRELRASVEQRWLSGEAPSGAAECGGEPGAYVACDGPYMIQVASPGINPPNLASVQELSAGLYRVGDFGPLDEAEVWIDDIRLTQPVSEAGAALALDARLVASDVGDISVSFVKQDGHFRQIGNRPTFRTTDDMRVAGTWRLDRFLPPSLGIAMPATVSFTRASVDPTLITGTDIRGSSLAALRKPKSWNASYQVALRRSRRGSNWLVRGLIDPLTIGFGLIRGSSQTELSESNANSANVSVGYNLLLGRAGPVVDLSPLVPGFLRGTELDRALGQTRLGIAPSNVRFSSGLVRDRGELTAFQVAIARDVDSLIAPTTTLNHVWRNSAGMSWQPLGMLTLGLDMTSTRDLRHYGDSTAIGRLAGASRRGFLGMDVGVERDRQLSSTFQLAPRISSWLRPRYVRRSGFTLSRSLTSRPPVQIDGDTLGGFVLPQTLNNSQSTELGASVDLGQLVTLTLGDSAGLGRALARLRPLELTQRRTRTSTFDLAAFEPTLGYQFAMGGMEHFLGQFGTNALGAGTTLTRSVTTGADLPFGLTFSLGASQTEAIRYQLAGGLRREIHTDQTEWPTTSLRWSQAFRGGPLTLMSLGTTWRNRSGTTVQPVSGNSTLTSAIESRSFMPDLQLGFRNGVGLTLRLTDNGQSSENNGTITESDSRNLSGALNWSFRLPQSVSRTRKRISSSLTFRSDKGTTCLDRPDTDGCSIISNTTSREVSASFATDLADLLRGGLDFGYLLNDASHLSRRISTIYMTVSFELRLFAGDLR